MSQSNDTARHSSDTATLLLHEPIKGWNGGEGHHKREATEEDNVVWLSSGCFCLLSEVRAIYQRVYQQDISSCLSFSKIQMRSIFEQAQSGAVQTSGTER